jgi:zinc protease
VIKTEEPTCVARTFACLAVVAVCASSAAAQDIAEHPRELTYEELVFDAPDAASHRHALSNGTVAFVVEDHTLPLVAVSVLVRTGEYLEPEAKTGLASLVGSQMRAGGSRRLSAADFDEEAAFLAAEIASSVGSTSGRAGVNALTKDVDAALDLFFDMLRHPRFEQGRLDLAKSQMLQRMERRNDSTASIEGRELGRLLRGEDHFSTRATTRASLEAITREDLVAFHEEYFHPGAFIFAVSGDIEPDEFLEKLESYLADWPAREVDVPEVPAPNYTPRPGVYVVDKPDVNQGRVTLAHLGSIRDNPDRYSLIVMNDILGGGGFSSRLLTRIRSDEGLAYSASSSFGLGTYYEGVFQAGFQSRSETVPRAAAIVLEEVDRIQRLGVTESELRTSKASFVETFSRSFSSAGATAGLFANDEYTGRDPSYIAEYRDQISRVTGDDVRRVAQQYLQPDELVILVVGSKAAIEAGDAENPAFSLDALMEGVLITTIPLPDPFTMVYPTQP